MATSDLRVTAAPRHRRDGQPAVVRGERSRASWLICAAIVATVSAGMGAAVTLSMYPHPDALSGPGSTVAVANQANQVAETVTGGSVEQAAAKVLPSVVELQITGDSGAQVGSGIVLTSDGLILTSSHLATVPRDDQTQLVLADGRAAPFSIVGADPVNDIAVVRAEGLSGLTPIAVGSSADLHVGQKVVAVGSPLGLKGTVTSGIISALNRPLAPAPDPAATGSGVIQTDAALNPGNFGGALVDMTGRLIGMTVAIAGPDSTSEQTGSTGLGFAIPIDQVKPISDRLIAAASSPSPTTGLPVGISTD